MHEVADGDHPVLESGPADPQLLGQETQRLAELRHRDQTAGTGGGEHVAQHPARIGQVVQGHRCPGQVEQADVRPTCVEVGLHRVDAVGEAEFERLGAQPLQRVGRDVDRHHVGLELLCQADRAGAGARAEVEQPASGGAGGRAPYPAQRRRPVVVEHLGVQVEQFGQAVLVAMLVVGVLVVGMVLVLVWLGGAVIRACRQP